MAGVYESALFNNRKGKQGDATLTKLAFLAAATRCRTLTSLKAIQPLQQWNCKLGRYRRLHDGRDASRALIEGYQCCSRPMATSHSHQSCYIDAHFPSVRPPQYSSSISGSHELTDHDFVSTPFLAYHQAEILQSLPGLSMSHSSLPTAVVA